MVHRPHVTRLTRKIPDEHRVPDVTFRRGRARWRKRIGIRACMTGVRAESFPYGAPELVELEICLAVRAEGLAIDAPGVRP